MQEGEVHKGWSRLPCAPWEPEAMLGQGSHTHILMSPKIFHFALLVTSMSQGYSAGEMQPPTAQQALQVQEMRQRVAGGLDFSCPGPSLP